jgi:hypothetical protein
MIGRHGYQTRQTDGFNNNASSHIYHNVLDANTELRAKLGSVRLGIQLTITHMSLSTRCLVASTEALL